MGGLKLPGVQEKGGRLYYRRKVAGKDHYIRLPDASSPSFAAAYARASRVSPEREGYADGKIGALVARLRASPEFKRNKPATRKNYNHYLDMIVAAHGDESVRALRPAQVYKLRDAMAETPGKANNWLTVMRLLMAYACQIDWRADNPAAGIKALPIGTREPWPSAVLEAALAAASPRLRLAIVTGLCSGQRIGDVVRIQHGWCRDGVMELVQEKTGKEVAVPMHPLWLAEIAAMPRKAVTILYDRAGKPYNKRSLSDAVSALLARVGATGFTYHGLRKNACCYLIELGTLSDSDIGQVLGMSPQIVRLYGKRSRALMVARSVADRITRGDVLAFRAGRING